MVNGGVSISKNTLKRKGMFIPVRLGFFFSVLLVNLLERFTEQEEDKDELKKIESKWTWKIIVDFLRQPF